MDSPVIAPFCPSCGQPRPERFCARCGEERVDAEDLHFRRFIGSAFAEFSNVDGTVPATLKTIITRPGGLTNEYLAGRRRAYLRPFQLYLLISIVFFLIQPHTGLFGYKYELYARPAMLSGLSQRLMREEIARTQQTEADYANRFNKRIAGHKQALMVFLVPLFALGLIALVRGRLFAAHIVFSVHFLTMLLLYFLLWLAAMLFVIAPLWHVAPDWLRQGPRASGDELIILFVFIPMGVYLALACRRVYGGGRWGNALRALALMVWLNVLIVLGYRTALFFTTFYSLKFFGS